MNPPRKRFNPRTWATPLTIGSFVLMTATGILMFFDIVPGFITFAHEWFSWIFVIGSVAHIAVNLRPFKNHLRSHWGRASVTFFVLALIASGFSWGRITLPQLKWTILESLVNAPISALAEVKGVDPESLMRKLEMQGIHGRRDQSLMEISEECGANVEHLIGIVFLPDGGEDSRQ